MWAIWRVVSAADDDEDSNVVSAREVRDILPDAERIMGDNHYCVVSRCRYHKLLGPSDKAPAGHWWITTKGHEFCQREFGM